MGLTCWGIHMPTEKEKYRFVPWEIEDVDGVVRQLPGGYADVTRGGGLKYDQVTFLGPEGTVRAALHLKKGHVRKLEQAGFASKVPQTGSG